MADLQAGANPFQPRIEERVGPPLFTFDSGYNLRNKPGKSPNPSNRNSGFAARKLFSVGNVPRTAIARIPTARDIARSSAVSPTYTHSSGRSLIFSSASSSGAGCGFFSTVSPPQTRARNVRVNANARNCRHTRSRSPLVTSPSRYRAPSRRNTPRACVINFE